MDFKEKLHLYAERINQALEQYVVEKDMPEKSVYSAMKYSLMAGGKRLRPVLALSVCEMLGGSFDEVMPYACAIEMIHTYSLIHDDLPAMDNDDYRRGRLTNHKVFGEARAILAGDALLNGAFELMLKYTSEHGEHLMEKVRAMRLISEASGASGMIGGQIVDLESEGKMISSDLLEYMHRCKTGALIKAPVAASAVICGANTQQYECLVHYAEKLGVAFQIKDDILDVEGDLSSMGKKSGSDAENNKSTFVTLYGLNESKKLLEQTTEQAINNLNMFGEKAVFLKDLATYLVSRNN